MTNESNVVVWVDPLDLSEVRDDFMACSDRYATSSCLKLRYTVPLVTHADYRALEEERDELGVHLVDLRESLVIEIDRNIAITKELAALRGKVGELVESDASHDEHIGRINDHSLRDLQEAAGRRDRALEALK